LWVGATEMFWDRRKLFDHDTLLNQQLVRRPSWAARFPKPVLKAG